MARGARWVVRLLTVCVAAGAPGCFSYTPGMPRDTVASIRDLPLPNVDAAVLEGVRDQTPREVYSARLMPGRNIEDVTNPVVREVVEKPHRRITRSEVVDGTLVRMVETPKDEFPLFAFFAGFVPNGYVLSARDVSPATMRLSSARRERMVESINARWRAHGVESDPTAHRIALEEGIPFHIPAEVPPDCRGVILHLWALARNEYEVRVMAELSSRGWFIIDVKPDTSAPAELREETVDEILRCEQEMEDLNDQLPLMHKGESASSYRARLEKLPAYQRRSELGSRIVDLRNPALPLCSPGDVGPAAAELGRRIDAALAENTRGTGAVLETAYRIHPALRGLPLVVMGFSAGALSAPTVAAKLRPDAAVVIGGGADLVAIALRSILTRGGVRVGCDGKPAGAELKALLEDEYLKHTTLDPYHTAPLLSDIPVLVVDAGMDTWVPSKFGELLFQRLGRPDRLNMALGGHEMLFYFLPKRARWIADWIERAAPVKTR